MKIVLTGGPSAGKTSIVEILNRSHRDQTITVPEAASILFRGGFPRQKEADFIICQQRAIFYVQKELEAVAQIEGKGRAIICDRGSLDGLAYWPSDQANFFSEVNSTMEEQIKRYDWVIHLDTAASEDYKLSKVRVEPSSEALAINEKVRQAWQLHPQRLIIPNCANFLKKVDQAVEAVNMMLAKKSLKEIKTQLAL